MKGSFRKLMREQLQRTLNNLRSLIATPIPQKGWIRTMREALGMSSRVFSQRMGCSQANVVALEKREKNLTISLQLLEQAAKAMHCKLVYGLVPLKPLDQILEDQARMIAKKEVHVINHSMNLEQQGLTSKQLKQQEDDLVQELLRGDSKKLWDRYED